MTFECLTFEKSSVHNGNTLFRSVSKRSVQLFPLRKNNQRFEVFRSDSYPVQWKHGLSILVLTNLRFFVSELLLRKTASYLKLQAIENSFKKAYGEVEDNIIIYVERLKTWDLRSNESCDYYHEDGNLVLSPRSVFSFEAAFKL